MSEHQKETAFVSFICPSCHQEIEAPADMGGQESECPTCASPIRVPAVSEPGTLWYAPQEGSGEASQAAADARKSRTIRIELPDTW